MAQLARLMIAVGVVALTASGCASAVRTEGSPGVGASSPIAPVPSSVAAVPSLTASSGHACPPRIAPTTDAHGNVTDMVIDYVDGVRYGGREYDVTDNTPVAPSRLDHVVAHVLCTLAGHPNIDPTYQMQDGDATFLTAGTALYAVNGMTAAQGLAAQHDGVIRLYLARPAG